MPVRWLAITWSSLSNQKNDSAVSTSPLRGIGVGSTTSKADRRSVWMTSSLAPSTAYRSRTLPRCRNSRLLMEDWNRVLGASAIEVFLTEIGQLGVLHALGLATAKRGQLLRERT